MEHSESQYRSLTPGFKVWLNAEGKAILGPGDLELIKAIQVTHNLTKAAESVGYSYKYAWKKLQVLKTRTGQDVAIAQRGGKGGGGHVELTGWGVFLIHLFETIQTKAEGFQKTINEELLQFKSDFLKKEMH